MIARAASFPRELAGILPTPSLPDPQVPIRLHSGLFTGGDGRCPLSRCSHCVTVSPSPEHTTPKEKAQTVMRNSLACARPVTW